MTEAPVQLTLGLGLRDGCSFANFHAGANHAVVEHLRALAAGGILPGGVYLWGAAGSGRSHLLQAVCNGAGERGRLAAYLPLAERPFPLDVLDGLERMDFVCLDDVDAVAGQPAWERALLRMFDRLGAAGATWLATADGAPGTVGFGHSGLGQALASAVVEKLEPLDEAACLAALQRRAARRQLVLPPDSARYLVRRCGGRTTAVFAALEALDRLSLATRRRITIPFIRGALATGRGHTGNSR